MAAAFALPINRAIDSNGLAMSGATLTFYATGTSTLQSVYTTSALTVTHANPVVADAGGLFPAIFLDPSETYRVILKSALGVTVADFDPVNGAEAFIQAAADFGAVGDGVTDDTAALQLALNTGLPAALRADATYLISSGLDHVAGSGLVCLDGIATIKAKTGVGGFNVTNTSAPRTGLDRNMFRCNETDDLILRNVHFTTDNTTAAYINGLRIYGGMGTEGFDVQNVSFSRFFVGAMVAISSIGSGRKRNLHISSAADSGTSQGNTYWSGGTPQTTVVEIDNDLIGSTASKPGCVRIDHIRDVLFSGQALTDYGQETDGVNMICQGANSTSGWDFDLGVCERIGELIDIQGWKNKVRIGTARFIYGSVIKLIHGAQHNEIDVGVVEASGNTVATISGSSSLVADRHILGNTLRIGSVINPGAYGAGLTDATGQVSVIRFEGSNETWKPKNNVVEVGSILGDGVNLDYVVRDGGSGADNENLVTIGKASGWVTASVSAPHTNVRVVYGGRAFAQMTLSAGQAIASGVNTKLAFDTVFTDTESLAVTASNKFTVKWPGVYRVTAQVRMDSWAVGVGDQWVLGLQQNVSTIASTKGRISMSAKDETALLTYDVYVRENDVGTAAADLSAYLTQDTGASKTVSNTGTMTFFQIAKVA